MSNHEDCINRRKPQIYSEFIYSKKNLLQCKIIDVDLIGATLNVPWIISPWKLNFTLEKELTN